jgi:hypothetical protein
MLEWCLDTVADQSPFPVIDDFGELEAGDVVYATIDLAKDPSSVKDVVEEKYALPGTIKINEDGTKTVELFESALWDGGIRPRGPCRGASGTAAEARTQADER